MVRRTRQVLFSLFAALAVVALVAGPAAAHGKSHDKHGHHDKHGKTYGATTLKLDPAAIAALTSLGVSPAPVRPATALAADELSFPITDSFSSAVRKGEIRHSGGIALTAGATTVKLLDFVIDPVGEVLTARVGNARVPILDLDFSTARLSFHRGGLTLGPVGGSLTAVAASALDGAFGLPAGTVPPGLKLGDATVRYKRLW